MSRVWINWTPAAVGHKSVMEKKKKVISRTIAFQIKQWRNLCRGKKVVSLIKLTGGNEESDQPGVEVGSGGGHSSARFWQRWTDNSSFAWAVVWFKDGKQFKKQVNKIRIRNSIAGWMSFMTIKQNSENVWLTAAWLLLQGSMTVTTPHSVFHSFKPDRKKNGPPVCLSEAVWRSDPGGEPSLEVETLISDKLRPLSLSLPHS